MPSPLTIFLLSYLGAGLLSLAQTTITVTNSNNTGNGSLRKAIEQIGQNGEINFDISLSGDSIILVGDAFTLAKNVTIDASSLPSGITIDGNSVVENDDNEDDETQGRIFEISAGATASLVGITLINGGTENGAVGGPSLLQGDGDDAPSGGAIYNSGNLTLTNCTLSDNFTGDGGAGSTGRGGAGGYGGAIYNIGHLTLISCTLNGNNTGEGGNGSPGEGGFGFGGQAGPGGNGGAIANASGATLIMNGCTLNDNNGGEGGTGGDGVGLSGHGGRGGHGGHGGAISNSGALTLVNCTFTDNNTGNGGLGGNAVFNTEGKGGSSGSGGGIHHSAGSLIMIHCTVSENEIGEAGLGGSIVGDSDTQTGDSGSTGQGGGIYASGTISLTNCIVSKNLATAQLDLVGIVEDPTYNILNSDALIELSPLGDFGGPTLTMPPLPSSPAVDAAAPTGIVGLDQRGLPRVVDATGIFTPVADLGAVELQASASTKHGILFSVDTDGDGLSNGEELIRGTDPLAPDNPGKNNLHISAVNPVTDPDDNSVTNIVTLSFAYRDPDINLQITRSTDMINFDTVIADSEDADGFEASTDSTPVEVVDENPPAGGMAFYRIEAPRPN